MVAVVRMVYEPPVANIIYTRSSIAAAVAEYGALLAREQQLQVHDEGQLEGLHQLHLSYIFFSSCVVQRNGFFVINTPFFFAVSLNGNVKLSIVFIYYLNFALKGEAVDANDCCCLIYETLPHSAILTSTNHFEVTFCHLMRCRENALL